MRKTGIFLFIFILFILIFTSTSISYSAKLFADNKDIIKLYFFYSKDCDICISVLEEINDFIRLKYNNVKIIGFELTENNKNMDLLFYLLNSYKYQKLDYEIPVLFLGDKALIGKREINKNFEKILQNYINSNNFYDNTAKLINEYKMENVVDVNKIYIKIPTVIVSALIDSIKSLCYWCNNTIACIFNYFKK